MSVSKLLAVAGIAVAGLAAVPQESQAFFGCCWRPFSCCYRPVNCCYQPCPPPCAPACSPCGYGGCGTGGCGVGGCGVGSPCGPGGCGISYRAPYPYRSFATYAPTPAPIVRSQYVYRPQLARPATRVVPVRQVAAPVAQRRPVYRTAAPQRRPLVSTQNSGWMPVSTQTAYGRN